MDIKSELRLQIEHNMLALVHQTQKIASSRSEGVFTPPSLGGTVVVPGNVGGVNWGGAAYDPERHLMFANTNRLIAWVKVIPRAEYHAEMKRDQDNRIYGEFGDQEPAPYGIYRTFLLSPGGPPCNRPPSGATVPVDLFTGAKVWEATSQGLRLRDREGALEARAAGGRTGHTHDVRYGWKAVCRDRGWRPRQAGNQAGGLRDGVRAAMKRMPRVGSRGN